MAGVLLVVGTPIGNLGDLSARVADTLRTVDAIACEDTRRTGWLLTNAGLKGPGGRGPTLLIANEHTEVARTAEILDRLAAGQRVALVSDAGMPGVSDPGRRIVDAVARAGFVRIRDVPNRQGLDPVHAAAVQAIDGEPEI